MKIGIDARFLGSGSKGLGRYTEQLVRNLELIDTKNQYVIFLRKENWDVWQPAHANFKKVLADFRWYSLEEQTKLPSVLRSEKCDLYHFPHFNVPLFAPKPFVVTVHDLILSHYPTIKASTLGPALYWFKHRMYQLVMRRALRASEHIITVSKYTAEDIQRTFFVKQKDVTVTYEGVDPLMSESRGKVDQILKRYAIQTPYLLYVGNAYPHKNLERLIDAYALLKPVFPNLQLVLVGKHDYFFKELISYSVSKGVSGVQFPGFVPDMDLGTLYEQAELYVFPSLYEGFGLPPLEAMMKKTPVASSNTSCLPEVLGAAAQYFSPLSTHDIVKVITDVLHSPELRDNMVSRGLEQIQRFSWKKMAEETHRVYTNIYGSKR